MIIDLKLHRSQLNVIIWHSIANHKFATRALTHDSNQEKVPEKSFNREKWKRSQADQLRRDPSPMMDRHAIDVCVCTEYSNIIKLQYGQSA